METRQRGIGIVMSVLVLVGLLGFCLYAIAIEGQLEPTAAPAPTMHTLEEIYNRPVWKISDKVFVDWTSNTRFVVCDEGTPGDPADDLVLDKETGLIWARDANLPGEKKHWLDALNYCRALTLGNRKGWRLPTVEELASLLVRRKKNGVHIDPVFDNKQTTCWTVDGISSSTSPYSGDAWIVDFKQGSIDRAAYNESSLSFSQWWTIKDINYVKAVRSVKK